MSASNQSFHFILSLRLYSSFITSRPVYYSNNRSGTKIDLGPVCKVYEQMTLVGKELKPAGTAT